MPEARDPTWKDHHFSLASRSLHFGIWTTSPHEKTRQLPNILLSVAQAGQRRRSHLSFPTSEALRMSWWQCQGRTWNAFWVGVLWLGMETWGGQNIKEGRGIPGRPMSPGRCSRSPLQDLRAPVLWWSKATAGPMSPRSSLERNASGAPGRPFLSAEGLGAAGAFPKGEAGCGGIPGVWDPGEEPRMAQGATRHGSSGWPHFWLSYASCVHSVCSTLSRPCWWLPPSLDKINNNKKQNWNKLERLLQSNFLKALLINHQAFWQ